MGDEDAIAPLIQRLFNPNLRNATRHAPLSALVSSQENLLVITLTASRLGIEQDQKNSRYKYKQSRRN